MAENLEVSWDGYQKTMCKGLGVLQQRGELVDMTLAADGHHVKVHQLVMSLASPYIKQLISSAHSTHPIIFLNKISFPTLQAILEYAYTGEVVVVKDKIGEFLEACKNLHIIGLDNMLNSTRAHANNTFAENLEIDETTKQEEIDTPAIDVDDDDDFFQNNEESLDVETTPCTNKTPRKRKADNSVDIAITESNTENTKETNSSITKKSGTLQFTVSSHGKLQVVLNRCVYSLRHERRDGSRYWRCIAQQTSGCPAALTTRDDRLEERLHPHNHPFHDKQILQRVRAGRVFSSLRDVQQVDTQPDIAELLQ